NYRFHRKLYDIAEQPQTLHFVQILWARYPFDLINSAEGRGQDAIEEHEEILQAFAAGDASSAIMAMRKHIESGWKVLKEEAEGQNSPPASMVADGHCSRPFSSVQPGSQTQAIDDVGPALDFRIEIPGQVFGTHLAPRLEALFCHLLAHLFRAQRFIRHRVELANDSVRRTGRCKHAKPGLYLHIGIAGFDQGGHIGKFSNALFARYGERAEPPVLNERHYSGRGGEVQLDVTTQKICHSRPAPFIGHADQVDTGRALEEFACQMRRGTHPRIGKVQRTRLLLG